MPTHSEPAQLDSAGRFRGPQRPRSRTQAPWWRPWLYLLPALAVYGTFLLFPLIRSVQFSLFSWSGLGASKFVGFDNYVQLAGDEVLRAAFGHAFVLIGFFALFPLCLGLAVAAVLNRARVRGLGLFRTVVFLPQVLAMVVVAVAWRTIYSPQGPLNAALSAVGLDDLTRAWLGDYTWTLPAVGMVGTWVQTGLVTVLMLAGMTRLPQEQYEAARLDGAGAVREFFALTLPSIRGEIAVALTLTIIAALKTFDLVYVMTGGGPGNSTTVPAYEVFQRAFRTGHVGSAAAIAVTLTVLIFGINVVINRLLEPRESR